MVPVASCISPVSLFLSTGRDAQCMPNSGLANCDAHSHHHSCYHVILVCRSITKQWIQACSRDAKCQRLEGAGPFSWFHKTCCPGQRTKLSGLCSLFSASSLVAGGHPEARLSIPPRLGLRISGHCRAVFHKMNQVASKHVTGATGIRGALLEALTRLAVDARQFSARLDCRNVSDGR